MKIQISDPTQSPDQDARTPFHLARASPENNPTRSPAGPAAPPSITYLPTERTLLGSWSPSSCQRETQGENDAHVDLWSIFFQNFPLIVTRSDGDSGDRCTGRRGCWLKVVLSAIGGGVPRLGGEDPLSLPPASPTPHRRRLRAARRRGGGVVSLPPTSSHSLVFVAVGSPTAFLFTMLFHYIMSIM